MMAFPLEFGEFGVSDLHQDFFVTTWQSLFVITPDMLPKFRSMVLPRQNTFLPALSLGRASLRDTAAVAVLEETMPGWKEYP